MKKEKEKKRKMERTCGQVQLQHMVGVRLSIELWHLALVKYIFNHSPFSLLYKNNPEKPVPVKQL